MGWGVRNRDVLMRVAAYLLLLAAAAVRASGATPAARRRILPILLYAEAVAFGYALDVGITALSPAAAPCTGRDEQAVLESLAHRLCVLALMLRILASRRPDVPGEASLGPLSRIAAGKPAPPVCGWRDVTPPDTS